jgi:uncharacterized protein (TIRG00374 family)
MRPVLANFHVRVPSWLLAAFGYAVSIGCLIWVLQGVDFQTVIDDVRALHWGWVAFGIVADIGVYIYQAFRWNLLLRPVARPSLWKSVQAIYVGLFSNEVLPLRPGELIRSYLQARWSSVPFSVAFSSAIIERIFDGIWLVVVFVLLTASPTSAGAAMPHKMVDLAKALGVVVVACTGALALVMFWKQRAHAALPKTRWGAKLRVLIDDLHIMGRSRSFYYAALASLPYLLVQVIPVYALIQAYDLDLGLIPALVVLVIWRLATVIPQAPGNIGPSQAALVLALKLFGVSKTTSTGLSLVTWGVVTLPLLFVGFIALTLTDAKLGDLRDRAKEHAKAPPATGQPETSKTL